jgi:hypothetical protein
MLKAKFCKFGDERQTFDESEEAKVDGIMQRLIALGLVLELDVGKFVLEQTRGEYPKAPYVKELLKTAVADEARHELGFKYAAKVYGSGTEADKVGATKLQKIWSDLADKHQPIAIAGIMEREVFLVTLGLTRLVGGSSLSELAMRIAEDESRHVATNAAITKWLKVDFDSEVQQAVSDTLEYAIGGETIKLSATRKLDLDFCLESAADLKATGVAHKLDRMTKIASHKMPFECSNKSLYTSRATESGQTVY